MRERGWKRRGPAISSSNSGDRKPGPLDNEFVPIITAVHKDGGC